MRRKRLQHAADILCRMFCGWRLTNSYRSLAALGSGTLLIDALSGSCAFDGVPIEELTIAGGLQHWLAEDLSTNHIPAAGLSHAALTARLTFSDVPPARRVTNEVFLGPNGKPVRASQYFCCAIACESEIATDEVVYRSTYQDVAAWPEGWP